MEEPIMLEHIRHLFVIDDDTMQSELIKDYLSERYFFTLKTYDNGEDAIQDIKTLKPEIVVLDYYLNAHKKDAKDGMQVLKWIKEISPTTEVVMFTGEDKLDVALESMRNGAYDYVVKGESAFKKFETAINRLGERHKLMAINIAQKRTIAFLLVVIALIIAGAIMYGLGVFD